MPSTPSSAPHAAWRFDAAGESDYEAIFCMMQRFYAEDRIALEDERVKPALRQLLRQRSAGVVLLPRDLHGRLLGYLVLTRCFSLEFGGSYGLLDELYLEPAARGLGGGRALLAAATRWAEAEQLSALRLEVNHHNGAAKRLYLRAGFVDDARDLLTLRLPLPAV